MAPYVTEVLLWLFVVNHGVALGAGLYEMRIVVPPWIDSVGKGEAAHFPDAGPRFWAFVTTVPLTLLTLASLVAAWPTPGARRPFAGGVARRAEGVRAADWGRRLTGRCSRPGP